MTATAETRRVDGRQDQATEDLVQGSPRERLQRGRPLRRKDVDLGKPLGRFWLRELRQFEKDEADEGVMRTEGDGKGNVTQHFDNRGHRTRLIASALVNDDGSNVYQQPLVEGVKEVGALPRVEHEALWAVYDELNPTSAEAKTDLGKGSAKATS